MGFSGFGFSCGFVVLLLFYSAGAEIVTIDVDEANNLLKSGYGYLDVRTAEEFKKDHVEATKILNIPYMFNTPEGRVKNPDFFTQVSSVCNKEDKLVVGCASGVRSLYATSDLQNAGFKHVSNMGGGHLAWVEKKLPTQKPQEELPSLTSQEELPSITSQEVASTKCNCNYN